MYKPENFFETLPPLFNAHLTECRKERHVIDNNISASHPNFILGIHDQKQFIEDILNKKFKSLCADDDAGLIEPTLTVRYYQLFRNFISNREFKPTQTLQIGIIAFTLLKKLRRHDLQKTLGKSPVTRPVIDQTQQPIEKVSPGGEHSNKRGKSKRNK